MSLRIKIKDGFYFAYSPNHRRVIGVISLCSTVLRALWSYIPMTFHEQTNCTMATHRAWVSDEWHVWEASVIKSTRKNLFLETHADTHRQWFIIIRNEQELSFSCDTYTSSIPEGCLLIFLFCKQILCLNNNKHLVYWSLFRFRWSIRQICDSIINSISCDWN